METLSHQFHREGYLHLKGFFTPAEVDQMQAEIQAVNSRLSTSGLNKNNMTFYSNVFSASEKMRTILAQQKILDLIVPIANDDVWIRWDQAVLKRPDGEEFPWHQDNGYNGLQNEHFQLWIALTTMKDENGGLWVSPGSHKKGTLKHRRVDNHIVVDIENMPIQSVDAEKGDVILFSSYMLHRTGKNVSNIDRLAYVVEYMKMNHYDARSKGPYFAVSDQGRSHPQTLEQLPAFSSLPKRLMAKSSYLLNNISQKVFN
jgi:ectoine hydroxylase-related dioxygenase (phytanoyl-CoA dioxygenase family)